MPPAGPNRVTYPGARRAQGAARIDTPKYVKHSRSRGAEFSENTINCGIAQLALQYIVLLHFQMVDLASPVRYNTLRRGTSAPQEVTRLPAVGGDKPEPRSNVGRADDVFRDTARGATGEANG